MPDQRTIEDLRILNQQGYEKIIKGLEKDSMGKFIGVVKGEKVAEAESFTELISKLNHIEPNPLLRMVFRVGDDYSIKQAVV